MSDFDRNAATAQYGRPLTRAEAAVVDEGLRAYMLRIYNYMVLGLAITQAVSSILSSAFVAPFTAAVTALLYIDQRMRKEAYDVELMRQAGLSG